MTTSLTGFGIIVGALLGGVAGLCGFTSAGLTAFSKNLAKKATKHEKIETLTFAKQNSVSELVSKALADKQITDSEFAIVVREVQKYYDLKSAIRSEFDNNKKRT